MSDQRERLCPLDQRRLGDEFAAQLAHVDGVDSLLLACAEADSSLLNDDGWVPPQRRRRFVPFWFAAGVGAGMAAWVVLALAS